MLDSSQDSFSETMGCPRCGRAIGNKRYRRGSRGQGVCLRCWNEEHDAEKYAFTLTPVERISIGLDLYADDELRRAAEASTRFSTRVLDEARFVPVSFAWGDRLPLGVFTAFVGEEGVGKGTLLASMIAGLTQGTLSGHFEGRPVKVLWIGDEDDCDQVVGPRLRAAGADLSMVRVLDGDELLDITKDADELERLIASGPFAAVVFEAVLDNIGHLKNDFNPREIRQALRPLRRVLHRTGAIGLITLHTNKLRHGDFRSLMAGSHQWNALARSSLFVARHPEGDSDQRVVVSGKSNYAKPVTLEFKVALAEFPLNGHDFAVTRTEDFEERPDIDIDVVMQGVDHPRL